MSQSARIVFVAILMFSASALAQECPKWFPDLRCEREARWEGFRKPIIAPYLFEDPFVTTGASLYYIYHEFPDDSALGGGEVHVAALQLRLALTERLGFIATKDGYVWLRPDLPLLDDEEGWMNLGAGLKYILWEAVTLQRVAPQWRVVEPCVLLRGWRGFGTVASC